MSDGAIDPNDVTSNLPPPSQGPNKRLQQNQAQVDEVVDIMRVNMEKVLERDAKLSKLDDRADALQAGASQFEASAGKLKNKYWWKNMKMNLIIGGSILLVLIFLIWYYTGGKKPEAAPAQAPLPVHPDNGPVEAEEEEPEASEHGNKETIVHQRVRRTAAKFFKI